MTGPEPVPAVSLADDLRRLEEIVRQLEREDGDLDRALLLFEEGVARLRLARERLAQAKSRVQKVLADARGTLRLEDLDPTDAESDSGPSSVEL